MINIKNRKNLILYLFGSNTSVFGDVLLTTALALHIMKLTQSPKAFGSILAMAYIPRFLLSLFSGAIIDRLDRKKVMCILDVFRGLLLLSLLLVKHIDLQIVTPLILIFAMADTFFIPSAVSIVPRLFSKDEIGMVNSLDQSIRSSLNVISPMIASLLFVTGGLKLILLLDGLTFLLSALSEMFFQVEPLESIEKRKKLINEIINGIQVIFADVRLASLLANGALTHLFLFTFIEVGMISLLLVTFKTPELHYGILQGVISGSAILASFLALYMRKKRKIADHINIGILGMLGSVLIFIPLGFQGFNAWIGKTNFMPLIYLSIGCFSMFLSFGYYVVFFRTFYQSEVPSAYLGRFSSIFMVLVSLSRMLGMYIYGILFEQQKLIYPILLLALGMTIKLLVHIPFLKTERKSEGLANLLIKK